MAAERHFLGFEQPALRSAAEFLTQRYQQSKLLRMNSVTVVTPTGRSGRRLMALLWQTCQEAGLSLLPPHAVTVSFVPELLYEPQSPFASTQTQQLAWAKALRNLDALSRRRLLRSVTADPHALTSDQHWSEKRWLETGRVFWRLYRELAAEGLGFSDVARRGAALDGFPDIERWEAMSALQDQYWAQLRELRLWDRQSARRIAALKRECRFDGELVFVGATDINVALRQMLKQVEDCVVALVHAPSEWQSRFDEFGCLVPEAWQQIEIPLQDHQWTVCDSPEDQAEEVASQLTRWAQTFAADQLTIGCPDTRLIPYIQRQLSARGAHSRSIAGRSISQSGPYVLLSALGRWLASDHRDDFASLGRHPDLLDWLWRQGVSPKWLGQLDEYHSRHLSATYRQWLGEPERSQRFAQAKIAIEDLTSAFSPGRRPITEWVPPLRDFLGSTYKARKFDRDNPGDRDVLLACDVINQALTDLERLPETIVPTTSATDAIDVLLASISKQMMIPPMAPDAIEILGWLELPLDDAKGMVIAGIHDGTVPQAVTSDQFLPNRLRQHLKIDDAARRYARDAYVLATLLRSRTQVHLVMGRLTEDGDPLRPSRLLLAASGDELVKRWKKVLHPEKTNGISAAEMQTNSIFSVPAPIREESCRFAMTVSEFKAYARCPYRYYLQHVLKLKDIDDRTREMQPATFGSVVHEVLEGFGRSALTDCTDSRELSQFLKSQLLDTSKRFFGDFSLPAVQIQLHQMELLLEAFAQVQSQRAADGWQIEFVESPSEGRVRFSVDGIDTFIRGRIDRIDRHRDSGHWQILDYKTSARTKTPRVAHQKDGEWVDFQLPLYRHLAAGLGVSGNVALGYVALPADQRVRIELADWSATELEAADEAARQIVRNVRNQLFWPPREATPWDEAWDDICMVGVLEAANLGPCEGASS